MIAPRVLLGGYVSLGLGMVLGQVVGPSVSNEVIQVEHGGILVVGGWALLELIRQGKRQATKDDIDKLRDEVTARNLDHRDEMNRRMKEAEERLEEIVIRQLAERERITDLQIETVEKAVKEVEDELRGHLREGEE